MNILPLTTTHISDLVMLHKQTLTGLSPSLGDAYLTNLYTGILTDAKTHKAFGAFENTALTGAIVLSVSPLTTFAGLNSLVTPREMLAMGLAVLQNPVLLIDALHRMRFNRIMRSHVDPSHEFLLLLMVTPAMQRTGIGTGLLKHILALSKKTVWVDTGQHNSGALAFYQKHGFKKVLHTHRAVLLKR